MSLVLFFHSRPIISILKIYVYKALAWKCPPHKPS